MPKQLRQMFACICVFCSPFDAMHLWNRFRPHFLEDFFLHYPQPESSNRTFWDIELTLRLHNLTRHALGLSLPIGPRERNEDTHDERQPMENRRAPLLSRSKRV